MDIRTQQITKKYERFNNPNAMEMEWFECVISNWCWKNNPDRTKFSYEKQCFPVLQVDPDNINPSPFQALQQFHRTHGMNTIVQHFGHYGCNFPIMIAHVCTSTTFRIANIQNVTISMLEDKVTYVNAQLSRWYFDNICQRDDPIRLNTVVLNDDNYRMMRKFGVWIPSRITNEVYRRLELEWLAGHY